MRRAKLGDVYAMHLPNGIKIVQWAYHIPKCGTYIRVFEGLHDAIPANIPEIVRGEHSYIIGFHISRAYRIGLVEFLENIPIPDDQPFPPYRIEFWFYELTDKFGVWIRPTVMHPCENSNKIYSFEAVNSVMDLPKEFQNVKLMDCFISPSWLMYLFDYDFNFDNPRRFQPGYGLGEKKDEIMGTYQERVDRLMEADKAKRSSKEKT